MLIGFIWGVGWIEQLENVGSLTDLFKIIHDSILLSWSRWCCILYFCSNIFWFDPIFSGWCGRRVGHDILPGNRNNLLMLFILNNFNTFFKFQLAGVHRPAMYQKYLFYHRIRDPKCGFAWIHILWTVYDANGSRFTLFQKPWLATHQPHELITLGWLKEYSVLRRYFWLEFIDPFLRWLVFALNIDVVYNVIFSLKPDMEYGDGVPNYVVKHNYVH